jgi:hypothetical protein
MELKNRAGRAESAAANSFGKRLRTVEPIQAVCFRYRAAEKPTPITLTVPNGSGSDLRDV